jgi:hypothetical protein
MNTDKEEITKALRLFFTPGDVFEVRILNASRAGYVKPHTESGYFDYEHIDDVPEALNELREYSGVYVTVNEVNSDLLARAANRIRPILREATTSDADIKSRRWLLIDCDAVRPSGISSTDEEHDGALYKAIEISEGLKSMGWSAPIFIDSGNGAQLMYRIDLPVDDNGLVRNCLKALIPVSDSNVDIDQTVHNPARIWRLPGTMNRKGDNVPERPHRPAKIIEAPERLEIVSEKQLAKLAGITPNEAAQTSGKVDVSGIAGEVLPLLEQFNIDDWISKYCPGIEGPFPWNGGRKWVFPVCPFNEAHTNKSAVITEQSSSAIGFTCHHNGCRDYDWKALRKLKEPVNISIPEKKKDVDLSGILSGISNKEKKEAIKPWHKVKNADIEAVLKGTILGEICDIFKSVTEPELPLEAALIKSIVLVGCALSGKAESVDMSQPLYKFVQTGAPLARLFIDTADGQVSNVYALLIGNSSSGKDIGRLLNYITKSRDWIIANRASAEGIADSLIEKSNGFINISEFQDWLNPNHWLNRACSFLTDSFDSGSFSYALSQRGKKDKRTTNYCYPNLIANIQPEIFESSVKKTDVTSGFLARFLFCNMPLFFGDPAEFDLAEALQKLDDCMSAFLCKTGKVLVHKNYLNHLSKMFRKESPEKLHPNWRRLVLSYGPRFATMLSVTPDTADSSEVVLNDRCWKGAEKLILWFFAHAEKALCDVEEDDPKMKAREKLYQKLFSIIKRKDEGFGVTKQAISRHGIWGTTAKERAEGLMELVERGILSIEGVAYKIIKTPSGWK